jgi:hypothetical protein
MKVKRLFGTDVSGISFEFSVQIRRYDFRFTGISFVRRIEDTKVSLEGTQSGSN